MPLVPLVTGRTAVANRLVRTPFSVAAHEQLLPCDVSWQSRSSLTYNLPATFHLSKISWLPGQCDNTCSGAMRPSPTEWNRVGQECTLKGDHHTSPLILAVSGLRIVCRVDDVLDLLHVGVAHHCVGRRDVNFVGSRAPAARCTCVMRTCET